MNDSWHSYPSVYALGHRAIAELLLDPVIVEEKIDGSQFSFGRFGSETKARSKGVELNVAAPEKMFAGAVAFAVGADLHDGWTYRAEWLSKPKHNTLAYGRAPDNGLMVFDINIGHETYLPYADKAAEAARIGLETAPILFDGVLTLEQCKLLLGRQSILGAQQIEGVVVKNYARFGLDKKALMGKYVSEAFKEVHGAEWKAANPSSVDIIDGLIKSLATEARWQKAVQHLADAGRIEGSPRDIGELMKAVGPDVEKECADEIKAKLWAWAWPKIRRGLTHGLPEWYKAKLLERQFEVKP